MNDYAQSNGRNYRTETKILANGSTWNGDDPLPLSDLYTRLRENTLDPRFEKMGNFIMHGKDGKVRFWGNFLDVSHVFDVLTNDPGVISTLCFAIRDHQDRARYLEARKSCRSTS